MRIWRNDLNKKIDKKKKKTLNIHKAGSSAVINIALEREEKREKKKSYYKKGYLHFVFIVIIIVIMIIIFIIITTIINSIIIIMIINIIIYLLRLWIKTSSRWHQHLRCVQTIHFSSWVAHSHFEILKLHILDFILYCFHFRFLVFIKLLQKFITI